ncbi:MAG TPA: NAD(P)-dependent oxidoreductase [Candidatus Acidoferrum sp.]|jgi:UDP-glucose 4-epimerase|nr:NAD(P)-dependent oxidoreductase [Candidatus Acidoferrum sp.]
MLSHLDPRGMCPARTVILGAAGFIGRAILGELLADGCSAVGVDRTKVDLLSPDASGRLAELLRGEDALVFVAARAPCKDVAMLVENLVMARAVCDALTRRPVAHVVYISSDAVYRDSAEPLTEASCAEPASLHGAMHLAREVALKSAFPGPLAMIRPTLVYGTDDPHNGYGPNRFRRLAAAGQDIVLFGEGEERRDHVAVKDIARLASLILRHRSAGIANAVSGDTVSFRELAEFTANAFSPGVAVRTTPRQGPMPHGGYRPFDNRAVLKAFPQFRFTPWQDGLRELNARALQSREPVRGRS